ncbi:general transcription factor II-I repeat domain-containing protein 2A-like [Macrobrachium rosenbergii]|uniref:general transcription factor II-I repeat domain-containing protein 2A-like n=1 Tax=Macrobrachium rosenbergii TaxID=79674 RepID=UPI0034D5DD6F
MNIQEQVLTASVSFQWFSIALDESNDIQDTAQVLIYIRGIDEKLQITEELLSMESLKDTVTGKDLYNSVINSLIRSRLSLDKLASITTDGAPSLIGKHCGLVTLMNDKIKEDFPSHSVLSFHCIIHQESLCRSSFKLKHGNECDEWVCDFAFAVDIMQKLNELNTKLQGKGLFAHELFADFKAIEGQFDLLSSPFACDVETAAEELQVELIDLQADNSLKRLFENKPLVEFYASLHSEKFKNLKNFARKMFVIFASTYICEQTFSILKVNKSKNRSLLTDSNLQSVLRISTSNLTPNFNKLQILNEKATSDRRLGCKSPSSSQMKGKEVTLSREDEEVQNYKSDSDPKKSS